MSRQVEWSCDGEIDRWGEPHIIKKKKHVVRVIGLWSNYYQMLLMGFYCMYSQPLDLYVIVFFFNIHLYWEITNVLVLTKQKKKKIIGSYR